MGDPGGIGLEVCAKALAALAPNWAFIPILICSKSAFNHPFHHALFKQFNCQESDSFIEEGILYLSFVDDDPSYMIGDHDGRNGQLAFSCLKRAVELWQSGSADYLCTAPLSKAALNMAGLPYTGHTSCLADLLQVSPVSMAFSSPELRVLLHSIHIPLSAVPGTITEPKLRASIEHAFEFGRICGFNAPRVGVAALNPHAGERGKLGFEDSEIIGPVVKSFIEDGALISGPHPADTIFWEARNDKYDVVLALYHDQALIPVKTLAFDRAVNVTVGLPFVRTSPDHGTAFDIAYQGLASETSMVEAIVFAVESST